ncbi:hypothetical protein MB02_10485 [Croceicoccus estronivorus]|uniref:FecR domain-containing protein n=1 Tax=Croceicoccus estronivorus TaxID=1172626 RepID=UPI00082F7160|nr:FecR domain-containing protein [Croceicoccus estronivorus]OCC23592.1 hypothetical protein MB02_10485 [Croceicoccus estronivorus]
MIRYVVAIFLVLASGEIFTAHAGEGGDLRYQVKRGDTLFDLAGKGLTNLQDYRIVQARNRIEDPRKLLAGSVLRVPRRLLRLQPLAARVVAFRGTVTVNGDGASQGMEIGAGGEVRTRSGAFLTLELPDSSRLTIPSDSRLKIVDLHKILLTNSVIKRFELDDGRVEANVKSLHDAGDRFEVKTPISVAGVRGTSFRVAFSEASGSAGTGVLEGRVAVEGKQSSRLLDAGEGVVVAKSGMKQPVRLLAAPSLLNPEIFQDGEMVEFRLEPIEGAGGYRTQLATDAGFIDIFTESTSDEPAFSLPDIPDGNFFVRFTALSAGGLEGLPSTYAVERRRNDVTATVDNLDDCPGRRCLRFRWRPEGQGDRHFRFQITSAPGGVPVIDEMNMSVEEIVITDLPAGVYYWRVQSIGGEGKDTFARWTEYQKLHVTPAR